MKLPLNASQTIAATAITAALLGGAYALGRAGHQADPLPADPTNAAAADTSAPAAPTQRPAPAPAPVDSRPTPQVQHASQQRRPQQPPVAAPALCAECSRVTAVRSEEREGQASGIGVIGGAVLGGLLGHQVGGGTGKKIATVGGAVAGGYAGNEVEKRSKTQHVWIVSLTDGDGSMHKHEQASDPQLRVGDVVVMHDGRLERR
jgi:outer membrane lipoprotein SlyB